MTRPPLVPTPSLKLAWDDRCVIFLKIPKLKGISTGFRSGSTCYRSCKELFAILDKKVGSLMASGPKERRTSIDFPVIAKSGVTLPRSP